MELNHLYRPSPLHGWSVNLQDLVAQILGWGVLGTIWQYFFQIHRCQNCLLDIYAALSQKRVLIGFLLSELIELNLKLD